MFLTYFRKKGRGQTNEQNKTIKMQAIDTERQSLNSGAIYNKKKLKKEEKKKKRRMSCH